MDIQIKRGKETSDVMGLTSTCYSLSHENPRLTHDYRSQLKALQESAVTDILNLPREQITFHLARLNDLNNSFSRFWDRYYHSKVPIGSEFNLEMILRLNLNEIFICPFLSFADHAQATEDFIDDLETTITFRQKVLEEFKEAVGKAIGAANESPARAGALYRPLLHNKQGLD